MEVLQRPSGARLATPKSQLAQAGRTLFGHGSTAGLLVSAISAIPKPGKEINGVWRERLYEVVFAVAVVFILGEQRTPRRGNSKPLSAAQYSGRSSKDSQNPAAEPVFRPLKSFLAKCRGGVFFSGPHTWLPAAATGRLAGAPGGLYWHVPAGVGS